MTAPKPKPLSDADLAGIEQQIADDFAEVLLDKRTTRRLLAEVRAHRAAALSEADDQLLMDLRAILQYDVPSPSRYSAHAALLDRLLGRSAT